MYANIDITQRDQHEVQDSSIISQWGATESSTDKTEMVFISELLNKQTATIMKELALLLAGLLATTWQQQSKDITQDKTVAVVILVSLDN